MNQVLKSASYWCHIAALTVGGALAVWGLLVTVQLHGSEDRSNSLERGIPSAVVLVLTGAYCVVLLRKGFSHFALPLFGASYVLLAIVSTVNVNNLAKSFAPSAPEELPGFYRKAVTEIVLSLLFAAISLIISARTAERRVSPDAAL